MSAPPRRPLIGITCYVENATWGPWSAPAALVPLSYVRAIEHAGGRAVLLPPSDAAVEETLDALDGLLLAGGADIDPARYGAEEHPDPNGLRPDRDSAEMVLLQAALDRDLPVLAVCRGMQLLNVARGGDLIPHLPDVTGSDMHRQQVGTFAQHDVTVALDSAVGRLLGDRGSVRSHHHQGIKAVGRGLREVAWAEDDTVEGIEDLSRNFAIGVLWHPEEGEDRKLFEALVAAASSAMGTR
ncbi:MAG: putative glutamine amidotransferase [Actinomycetota bacterium]|nr:putative glutamine amidotransferase [Actinomycetota bacterium]